MWWKVIRSPSDEPLVAGWGNELVGVGRGGKKGPKNESKSYFFHDEFRADGIPELIRILGEGRGPTPAVGVRGCSTVRSAPSPMALAVKTRALRENIAWYAWRMDLGNAHWLGSYRS